MHKIKAEGTTFFYLAAGEDPAVIASSGLTLQVPDPGIVSRIRQCPYIRLVAFERMLNCTIGDIYYLFWNNGADLEGLDRRVLSGTYADEEFAASVKTSYQETICEQCGSRWQTLIIPPGDPYPGAPGLLERKIAASKFLLCPACRASLRQMVVKIIGPADGGSTP